jgi:tRNA (cytidine/uridine-2'-O-)-methyltransferase
LNNTSRTTNKRGGNIAAATASLRMRLALFQPDIPQNVGAAMRLTGCLGVALDVILPCAFNLDDKAMKRAALDYGPLAHVTRHASWADFLGQRAAGRLILMTTKAEHLFPNFAFRADDTILLGSESAGAPEHIHDVADARLRIPLVAGARSLNVVTTGAIALGEALRQTGGFPAG